MFYSQLIRKGLRKICSFSQTSDRYDIQRGVIADFSPCSHQCLCTSHYLLLTWITGNWNLYFRLPTHLSSKESPSHTPQKKDKTKTPCPLYSHLPPALCTLTYQAGIPSAQQHGLRERARSTAPSQPHSLCLGQSPRLQGGGFQPPQAEEGRFWRGTLTFG